MIKLTINADGECLKRTYLKKTVIIGAADAAVADIRLHEETLKEIHVKIVEEQGRLICYNVANDPFVTINDIPFGRREIKEQDSLQIGETIIGIGHENSGPEKNEDDEDDIDLDIDEDDDIDLDDDEDMDIDDDEDDDDDLSITELVKEVEKLEREAEALAKEEMSLEEKGVPCIKVQDEVENTKSSGTPENTHYKKKTAIVEIGEHERNGPLFLATETNSGAVASLAKPAKKRLHLRKRVWLLLLICLIGTFGFISNGVFERLQKKAYTEEVDAARSISDISMALTYAKINNITPHQQNWTDPVFLKNGIASVLSPFHLPFASVDNQGRINQGQYLLRIYTSRDLSRFVIIAQPEASLMQWLAPQKAIVLDSLSMKLHTVDDLRPLNRLLVKHNSLNGDNGKEVFDLINAEKNIPLASIGDLTHKHGFIPPKELELMNIGAHNYVYNAPRYAQVGDRLMQEAIDLASRPGSSTEVKKLQDQLNIVSQLPYAVMYTFNGLKVALKAQKALAALLPDQKFLIAYIQSDEAGKMKGSHLILDNDAAPNSPYPFLMASPSPRKEVGSYQPLIIAAKAPEYLEMEETAPPQVEQPIEDKIFSHQVNKEHALYLKIQNLAQNRKAALEPSATKLITLVKQNNENRISGFFEEFHALASQYEEAAKLQEKETFAALKALYDEHDDMPLSEFSQYVNAAGMSAVAASMLHGMVQENKGELLSEEEFNEQIETLQAAHTLNELNQIAKDFHQNLRIDNIPDSKRLVNYQNKVRTTVLEKLNELLFSPDSKLAQYELHPGNRKLLLDTLTASWITDPEERNFYLNEFDLLVDEQLYNHSIERKRG